MNSVSPITAYNQKVNFKNLTKPNFKADKENTIEVKQEKGLSKEAKFATGVITALALAGGITYAILRRPGEGKRAVDKAKEELGKDWKEAMEFFNIKQLPEHIEFKEAKTLDEALRYGKDVLGIEYRMGAKGWNVDSVNFINKGLTDISNAMKGRANLPERAMPSLTSADQNKAMAEILNSGKDLDVNGKFFQINGFDEMFSDLPKDSKLFDKIGNDNGNLVEFFNIKSSGNFDSLIEKFKNDKLDYIEKWQFYNTLGAINDGTLNQIVSNPAKIFKVVAEKHPELNLNYNDFCSKTLNEQSIELKNILQNLKKNGKAITININGCMSPYKTIYHEMGHSQNFVTRYMSFNANDRKVFKDKCSDFATKKEQWDRMRERGEIRSWHSPILEFFNPENQAIAKEVSNYAAKTPDEFIAETFVKKVQGFKVSDKVEALYKKYNGPEILNPPPVKEPIWHFE